MLATLAVGGGIALSVASLYSRVRYKKSLPLVDRLYTPDTDGIIGDDDTRTKTSLAEINLSEEEVIREVLIIGLTGATAMIHVTLGAPIFVLNGIGYAGLLGLHYLVPPKETYRQYTRSALFGYTGVTVIGYFIVNGAGGFTNSIGIADKLIELGLLAVLWQDQPASSPESQVETYPQIPVTVDIHE
jgi:hypothetical protein